MSSSVVPTIESVDVLVIGTGLTESILAAALSRAGYTLVHADSNAYYGTQTASLTSHDRVQWLSEHRSADLCGEFGDLVLDVHPRLLFCRSEMTSVLRESGVGSSLEFQAVRPVWVWTGAGQDGDWMRVPHGKEDVFTDPSLSLLEKRRLMRLLTSLSTLKESSGGFVSEQESSVAVKDSSQEEKDSSFMLNQYLIERHQVTQLQHQQVVAHALALDPRPLHHIPAQEGIKALKTYMHSVGVYGPFAMLASVYGTSELSQSFCRMSAVHGGIYIMGQPFHLTQTAEETSLHLSTQQPPLEFRAPLVISSLQHAPSHLQAKALKQRVAHFVVRLSHPVPFLQQDGCSLLVIPPCSVSGTEEQLEQNPQRTVYCLHMDTSVMGLIVLRGWTLVEEDDEKDSFTPRQRLEPIVARILKDMPSSVIQAQWYYEVSAWITAEPVEDPGTGRIYLPDLDSMQLDVDGAVRLARGLFDRLVQRRQFEGEAPVFLPQAMNPEDTLLVQTYLSEDQGGEKCDREDG